MSTDLFMQALTGSTLAEALILMSPWKPVLLLLPFVGWAWLVAKVFDKHCAQFFLPRENWNTVHLSIGLVALAAAILMPIRGEAGFWVALLTVLVLLALDIGVFVYIVNKDDRVPEDKHLRLDFSAFKERAAAREAAKKQGKVELVLRSLDKLALPVPDNDKPEFEVRVAAEAFFIKALDTRAAQVEVVPAGNGQSAQVEYMVDGVRTKGEVLPMALASKAIDLWKTAAKLDVNDRRRRLQGDAIVERGTDKRSARITTSGTQAGMRLTILIDPEKQVRRKLADLGLLEPQLAEFKALLEEQKGVVLLSSPADGGRTTTMYTAIKGHDAYTKNIQTLEAEVQDALEGVRQNKFDGQAEGPDFATNIRSILRRDPDVVGVGDLPDVATAREIAKAEPERMRIYVSMRADSALGAVQAYFKAVENKEQAAGSLWAAIGQRLVRKLCVNCRQPYSAPAEMLKKVGIPADKPRQFFKKGGQVMIKNKPEICPMCQGGGYYGQEGIFEIYRISKEERALLSAGDWAGLKTSWRKRGLPSLQQAALAKAVAGVTSIEEVMRVTGEGAKDGASAPAAAPGAPAAPAKAASR